jgi:serine protease Do
VVNVFPDTPAADARIKEGDVITAIEGIPIESPRDLSDTITERDPGEVVEIEILRKDGPTTVSAELDRRPVTLPVR